MCMTTNPNPPKPVLRVKQLQELTQSDYEAIVDCLKIIGWFLVGDATWAQAKSAHKVSKSAIYTYATQPEKEK